MPPPSDAPLDVLVLGGTAIDYLGHAEVLPRPGTSVEGDALVIAPGGKGANAAVAAARLGGRAALVSRVGRDEAGAWLREGLAAEGVDLRHLGEDENAPTPATLIMVDAAGEKLTLSRAGANGRISAADVARAGPLFEAARVLLAQLEVPLDVVAAAVARARRAGLRVVLDPAPARPLPDALLRQVDVVTPNAWEIEVLTGRRVAGVDQAHEAAAQLLRRGAGAVTVEVEGEGKLVAWPGGHLLLPMLPVAAVDTTGAGDAFAAGLAVGLAEGLPLAEAARLGNACAGLATTALGAQAALPTRAAVDRLLAEQPDGPLTPR